MDEPTPTTDQPVIPAPDSQPAMSEPILTAPTLNIPNVSAPEVPAVSPIAPNPTPAPVMDIQPPQTPEVPVSVATAPVDSSQVTPTGLSDDSFRPDTQTPPSMLAHDTRPVTPATIPVQQPAKKPMLAIIIAIAIAIILIAVAVFMYVRSKNNSSSAKSSSTSKMASVAPTATTKDVDQTTQAVDAALTKASSTQDVSSTDLSDVALGL